MSGEKKSDDEPMADADYIYKVYETLGIPMKKFPEKEGVPVEPRINVTEII